MKDDYFIVFPHDSPQLERSDGLSPEAADEQPGVVHDTQVIEVGQVVGDVTRRLPDAKVDHRVAPGVTKTAEASRGENQVTARCELQDQYSM
jgi:hypothetical protein